MECNPKKIHNCKICNKIYSCRQNLWKHNNKFHNDANTNINIIKINKPTNQTKTSKINLIKNKCNLCNKILSRQDSAKRHEDKCKIKKNNIVIELEKKNRNT